MANEISQIIPLGLSTPYNIKDKSAISDIQWNGTSITVTKRDGTSTTLTCDITIEKTIEGTENKYTISFN